MNTILSAWCAFCDHLAPFAAMAVVPLLLWIHHFETMPPADLHESGSTESRNSGVLIADVTTEKGVTTTDALEEWAA